MKNKDAFLLNTSFAVIVCGALFTTLSVFVIPGGDWIFSEVATESAYLCLAVYTYYHLYRMGKPMIALGWSLFCLGLAFDLSDEISDSVNVLHKNLEDWASMIGIFIFAVGFHRANITLTQSLDEEQERAESLADQAFTDELTGIANRSFLLSELQILIEKHKTFCLYFIDLNKFKPANDTYGHEVGDLLLQAVTNRLSQLSRHQDILARWGGDEFILVLSFDGLKSADPSDFAHRIMKAFDEPFEIRTFRIELSASIGFASFPEHARSHEELIHKADLAMYQSKRRGDGPCRFDPSLLAK